ncbi:hypothetical protein VCHC17A1_1900B, partial [Vibrio cholerae HC-17A1]
FAHKLKATFFQKFAHGF